METVVVQGQKLNVETRIDRKIYTVPQDAQTTLGALSDLLNVIPSVDVDPDGAVSLRGDTNVLILIDGKPATQLQGSKVGDNLQSIPASDIERIEILTTPVVRKNSVTHRKARGSIRDAPRWPSWPADRAATLPRP
jgi:outer membrane receptor protein involved in Fe transport